MIKAYTNCWVASSIKIKNPRQVNHYAIYGGFCLCALPFIPNVVFVQVFAKQAHAICIKKQRWKCYQHDNRIVLIPYN